MKQLLALIAIAILSSQALAFDPVPTKASINVVPGHVSVAVSHTACRKQRCCPQPQTCCPQPQPGCCPQQKERCGLFAKLKAKMAERKAKKCQPKCCPRPNPCCRQPSRQQDPCCRQRQINPTARPIPSTRGRGCCQQQEEPYCYIDVRRYRVVVTPLPPVCQPCDKLPKAPVLQKK